MVKLVDNFSDLTDLNLELNVFRLLALVCLENYIIQDVDFFCQISLDVDTLSLGNVLNSILLSFKLFDLLPSETDFLLQVHDLFLEFIDEGLEAKGLIRS